MSYDPNNAKESAMLPRDAILEGEIESIRDGKVKDFVQNTEKWTGDIEQKAISVLVKIMHEGNEVKTDQVFTYNEKDGQTTYAPNSNLGKYKRKYGELPKAGQKVKIATNNDGFGKVKLE